MPCSGWPGHCRPSWSPAPTTLPSAAAHRWWWSSMGCALGAIELKDTVKPGMADRFAELRAMGITHDHDHR